MGVLLDLDFVIYGFAETNGAQLRQWDLNC